MHAMSENSGAMMRSHREARGWSRADLARRLADAADEPTRRRLPAVSSLVAMIKQWESGRHTPSARYRVLCSLAFDLTEHDLFPIARPTPLPLPVGRAPASVRRMVGGDRLTRRFRSSGPGGPCGPGRLVLE
ncbi:hypothetical protein GCM10009550_56570 [Actinocorallia libanotica]|uniref:HTH cro/C1-type domain-containing protein n=1 Tax=Actinocorallia libanotica TaxID=46162 RepID=A0ABN1RRW0_9ACTN